jgi:hypothetical protein
MPDEAIKLIDRAAVEGFITAPETLKRDPALSALRNHDRFPTLLRSSEKNVREARAEWNAAASTVGLFSLTSKKRTALQHANASRLSTRAARPLDL